MNKDEFQNASSGKGRKLFLVVVLLAVLGAFGYDYLVAKPAYQEGYEKLKSMLDPKKDETGEAILANDSIVKLGDVNQDGIITQEDVHKHIGREPKATETPADNTIVETYTWPRGIPMMTYNAYVVYTKGEKNVTLYKVTERQPTAEDYRAKPTLPGPRPPGLGRAMPGGGAPEGEEGGGDDGSKKDDAINGKAEQPTDDSGAKSTESGDESKSADPDKSTDGADSDEKADDGKGEEESKAEGAGEESAGEGNGI